MPPLSPGLAGVAAGEMDVNPFPVLPAPGDASPAGVSFVPNCSLFPPSSLPPVVSHPSDSKDVSWGAGPPSWGKRETWSRCQHFVNSPAFERDSSAHGRATLGCWGQRERRGLILMRLLSL